MDPVSVLTSALVTNFFGLIFGGNNNQQGQVLERFLDTLSTNFANRVENIVRDAFTEQNLLEIKTDLYSAACAFRTFTASHDQDETQLTLACQKVIEARSRVFTASEQIISRDLQYMQNENTEEKGAATRAHNKAFQAAITALQAISALDMMVFEKKVRRYPQLRAEAVTRVGEYINLANQLMEAYRVHQYRRTYVKFYNKCVGYDTGDCGYWFHIACDAKRYLDATVIEHITETIPQIDPKDFERLTQPFNQRVVRRHNDDRTITNAATQYLTQSRGNIQDTVTILTNLQNAYRN